MRLYNAVAMLLLPGVALMSCSSSNTTEPARSQDTMRAYIEQQGAAMPEAITARYPALNVQTQGRPEVVQRPAEDYFDCNKTEPSTITDDIPPLDVSFIETDIMDAILELSLLTGISIITDDSIEGMVSVNFIGKTLDEVLEAIIAPGNFGFKKYDTFIYVGSQSPVSPSFHLLSETCLYKPVFLHPRQVVELLTPFYQQYVNYFEGHDHISVVAPETIQQRIQKDIRVFDQSPQQILLEMSVVEVSAEALDLLGVKWNQAADSRELLMREGRGGGSVFSYYDPTTTASPVAQAFINSVSALGMAEDLQVRAMPSMVTLNGREANFSSMQTSWLPMMNLGMGMNNQQNAVNYGVDLRIVPFISNDDQIRLEIIQASVSDLTEDKNDQPLLVSHSISTSVLMIDGETLVLGGLLQKKQRNRRSGVPGASKTPVIGGLFRHKEEHSETTEVLIVIRPQIMSS
jgi:type IV pilus assembly protein PilQ